MLRISKIVLCLLLSIEALADNFGFYLAEKSKHSISFEMVHNLIVIKAAINGLDTQRFIVDSGAEGNIIFSEVLPSSFHREILKDNIFIGGFGMKDSIAGKVLGNNSITIDDVVFGGHLYFIEVQGIYDAVSDYMGMPISGILGVDLFKNLVLKIDYDDSWLTFYAPEYSFTIRNYEELPIRLSDNKIFTEIMISTPKLLQRNLSVIIDMGESKSLVLLRDTVHNIVEPDKVIHTHLGIGIAGDISGSLFYYPRVKWSKYHWDNVLVAMPDDESTPFYTINSGRAGNMGADILRRFTLIFDVPHGILYLKRNKNFREPFGYNKSGIVVQYDRINKKYFVLDIDELSPASVFGILPGDIILTINHNVVKNKSYDEVIALLSPPDTQTLALEIERNGVVSIINILLFSRL
jgi:hypothetical protein